MLIAAKTILPKIINDYLNNKIKLKKQNHQKATFTKIIKKHDGKINWNLIASEIYNQYRAYKKWPGIFTFWRMKNGEIKKISLIEIALSIEEKTSDKKIGEVFKKEDGKILIQAKKGCLIVRKIQLEGKNVMDINNFINGYQDFIKSVLN